MMRDKAFQTERTGWGKGPKVGISLMYLKTEKRTSVAKAYRVKRGCKSKQSPDQIYKPE